MRKIYKYFCINNGKITGKIMSSFKVKARNVIELSESDEHLFNIPIGLLAIKDGKIVVLKDKKVSDVNNIDQTGDGKS